MTEKSIQEVLMKFLYPQGNEVMCTNFTGHGLGECDLIAISDTGFIHEFEIKCSRSDFKNDFKKDKHKKMKEVFNGGVPVITHEDKRTWYNAPNKFSFVCPEGLIKIEDMPVYYGLFYVNEHGVYRVQMPKKIHTIKADMQLVSRIARQLTCKITYGCAYLTYKNKQINK